MILPVLCQGACLKEGIFSNLEGSRCSVTGLALAAPSEVCSGSDACWGEAAQPCCGNCSTGFALRRQKQSGNEIKALDLPAYNHRTDPSLSQSVYRGGWLEAAEAPVGEGGGMAAVCAGTGASWLLTLAGWQEDVLDQLCG